MKQPPTKERILTEALTLFAEKGYEAVSVAEIAEAVGIRAPSLYKHYKSKQDIFRAILDETASRYGKQAASMRMNGTDAGSDTGLYLNLGEEELVGMGRSLFLYFLHDEFASRIRRMLTIEQFRNGELASLYRKQYVDDPLSYQGAVFAALAQAGVLTGEDPGTMALQFYAPVFLLLALCDSSPEREPEALRLLEGHIRQFCRLYRRKER